MEDKSRTLTTTNSNKKPRTSTTTANNHRGGHNQDEDFDDKYDVEAYQTLTKSFKDVQSVLDENRSLIQQVNDNHQSKLHENMVKNVGLIREINCNITKVMGMYEDLNVDFINIARQRIGLGGKSDSNCDSGNDRDDRNDKDSYES